MFPATFKTLFLLHSLRKLRSLQGNPVLEGTVSNGLPHIKWLHSASALSRSPSSHVPGTAGQLLRAATLHQWSPDAAQNAGAEFGKMEPVAREHLGTSCVKVRQLPPLLRFQPERPRPPGRTWLALVPSSQGRVLTRTVPLVLESSEHQG
jgi:hypothetical protein